MEIFEEKDVRKSAVCEFCGRDIRQLPVRKVLRGEIHLFCSEFCFRLYFYDAPRITYAELQSMYAYYCVSLPTKEFQKTIDGLVTAEEK